MKKGMIKKNGLDADGLGEKYKQQNKNIIKRIFYSDLVGFIKPEYRPSFDPCTLEEKESSSVRCITCKGIKISSHSPYCYRCNQKEEKIKEKEETPQWCVEYLKMSAKLMRKLKKLEEK